MKNRAKCKKCQAIIESFHSADMMECKCGRISVYGGDAMYCSAIDFNDFLRVDDEGNEIIVDYKPHNPTMASGQRLGDLLKELDDLIELMNNLPQGAKDSHVTQSDLTPVLSLISAMVKELGFNH